MRHKLLLGLGLVVCIMALLLGGTLRGLWSYHVTINAIKAKVQELIASESVNSAIAKLIAPENTIHLLHDPAKLDKEIKMVDHAIDVYDIELDKTIAQVRDPLLGGFEKGLIEDIRKKLNAFKDKAAKRSGEVRAAGMAGGVMEKKQDLEYVQVESRALQQAALDLRSRIKDELDTRMGGESRSNYQIALWIIVPSAVFVLILMAGLARAFYLWVFNPIRDLEVG